MRNMTRTLVLTALAIAALGAPAVMAKPRPVGVYTGGHARAMNQIYQANQHHNAVINQVQQNINSSEHRY